MLCGNFNIERLGESKQSVLEDKQVPIKPVSEVTTDCNIVAENGAVVNNHSEGTTGCLATQLHVIFRFLRIGRL